HDGSGGVPGVKYGGSWDLRPHRARLVHVNDEVLSLWGELTGFENPESVPLLYPVSNAEAGAIEALSLSRGRLRGKGSNISSGYHEMGAKQDGLIRWETGRPWS